MKENQVNIAIVGAGAGGLMAAIWAGRTAQMSKPLRILLLDAKKNFGAKILMSGGTRCNVTNKEVTLSDFHGGPSHFIKHIFEAFTPVKTINFFDEIGVKLVLESTDKYFPRSNSAQTVLDALVYEVKRLGIQIETGIRITEINKSNSMFHLRNSDGTYSVLSQKVILTTGGLSHPTTGSDGVGYEIAKGFGHTLTNTFAALTPLLTNDKDWQSLSGISFKVGLSFFKNGKKEKEYCDSFLFTHFGFSGPAALDMSRFISSAKKEETTQIIASFLTNDDENSLRVAFQEFHQTNPNKTIKNLLIEKFLFPERFVEIFLKKIKIRENEIIGKMSRETRNKIVNGLLFYPLEVTGVFGYQKAEVTAGGLNLKEIEVSTMESKKTEGLYFAGEILDVDGRIGGFNFQWAWSTGAIAGQSVARSLIV